MAVDGDLEAALGTPRSKCRYGVIYEGLSDKGKALVDLHLPDGIYAISADKLSAVLAKNGRYAHASVIKRHRRGGCACYRSTKT